MAVHQTSSSMHWTHNAPQSRRDSTRMELSSPPPLLPWPTPELDRPSSIGLRGTVHAVNTYLHPWKVGWLTAHRSEKSATMLVEVDRR